MLSYLSNSPGIGGTIKSMPEDFIVEEIGTDGTVFGFQSAVSRPDAPGKYVHFILQKRNWSTSSAIGEIAKRLHVSQKNFNIAGNKDKLAITTQLASARGVTKESLLALRIKDISINGVWSAADRVHLGELIGNRFTIKVRDTCDNAHERVAVISNELAGKIPNYFGEQRFGSTRKNTHLIGLELLKGNLEEATIRFLCETTEETNAEAREARKELSETRDFSKALGYFPKHLRLERSVLAHLANNPNDFTGALRHLPRNILLLFVHAFQSHMFNRLLSDRLAEGQLELEEGEYFCGETLGFPNISKSEAEGWICGKLIGYSTPLNAREKSLLDELGIEKEAFRMKMLPELASKGSYRTLLAPLKDFNFNGGNITFAFALPSGSYATVAMREFMDRKNLTQPMLSS